ncbi:hypothetical protein OUZ56_009640 [Daphnia magna]|uniref:Uncharacterized protein n=1 Tax=Daphnia magna TaxID=35525 RepID=A0ABR0AGJ6_9CRUS|nr:hypothetical protein OUZ56_009640 [Daphnia magna]
MESDDDRIEIILSQMPLLENEEVEVAVFETIMEKEDDEGLNASITNGENGESGPTARTFADVHEGGTRTIG